MLHHIRNLLKIAQETLKSAEEMVASLEHQEFIDKLNTQQGIKTSDEEVEKHD